MKTQKSKCEKISPNLPEKFMKQVSEYSCGIVAMYNLLVTYGVNFTQEEKKTAYLKLKVLLDCLSEDEALIEGREYGAGVLDYNVFDSLGYLGFKYYLTTHPTKTLVEIKDAYDQFPSLNGATILLSEGHVGFAYYDSMYGNVVGVNFYAANAQDLDDKDLLILNQTYLKKEAKKLFCAVIVDGCTVSPEEVKARLWEVR